MAHPRFLGWREWTLITPCEQLSPDQENEEPQRCAIWSDEDSLGHSDGFNLARWRAECDQDYALHKERGEVRRSRQATKVEPHLRPPKHEPVYFPAIPRARRGALEPVDSPKRAARRRAAYGSESFLVPGRSSPQPAKPAEFEHLPPIAGLRSLLPPPAQHGESVDLEIAETALSQHDPHMSVVCRGNMASVLAERELQQAELAQQRRCRVDDISREHRRLAAEWRCRAEEQRQKGRVDDGLLAGMRDPLQAGGREAIRAERVQRVLTRIKTTVMLNKPVEECRKPVSSLFKCITEHQMADVRDNGREPGRSARVKFRQALFSTVIKRKKHKRHVTQMDMARHLRFMDIPEAERKKIESAFDLYKDESGQVLLQNVPRCLHELGLSGVSAQEKVAVEVTVRNVARPLRNPDGNRVSNEVSALVPTSPRRTPASPRRGSVRDGSAPEAVGVQFFSTEIVPAVREQLCEERTDQHFQDFMVALNGGTKSVLITRDQFEAMAARAKIDAGCVAAALPKTRLIAPRKTRKQQGGAEQVDEAPTLFDFEQVHTMLMQLEEQTYRIWRAQELAIKSDNGLPDSTFWTYRHELLRLHDMFRLYDVDHSGFLSHEEVRKLLKHVGLQPYTLLMLDIVDNFLHAADTDGNHEIDFKEFLGLMSIIREHQTAQRRDALLQEFIKVRSGESGPLGPKDYIVGFCQAGLIKSTHDRELALQAIREFDVDATSGLNFDEYQCLGQRVVERIFSFIGEQNLEFAKSIGFDMDRLAECQWVFDHHDVNETNSLSLEEVEQVLKTFMIRAPTIEELEGVFQDFDVNTDGEITFKEFLMLMKLIVSRRGMFSREKPFTIASVPEERQRDILRVFPVAEFFIRNLEPRELLETVANFLGVEADTNLRELPQPVRNMRQLIEFARRKRSKLST